MSHHDAHLTVFSMFLYLLPLFFAIGLAAPIRAGEARAARPPQRTKRAKVARVAKAKKTKKKKPVALSANDHSLLDKYRIERDHGKNSNYNRMPL